MNDFPVSLVVCATSLMLVAILVSFVSRRIHLPYTIALVLIGMGLHQVGDWSPSLAILHHLHLTPNFILYLLLPTLIFDAAIHLDCRALLRNLVPILLLAVPGVLVVTAVIGVGVARWTPLSLNAAMLFGALISTTDPVACIALFNEIGAPARLTMLVDGESLFNDATAIVMFDIVSAIVAGSLLLANPHSAWTLSTLAGIPGRFLWVFLGGAAIGAVVGFLIMLLTRFARKDPLTEVALTTVVAYAAFTLANAYLHFSGVMAACTAGMVVNFCSKRWISPDTRSYLHRFWSFAAYMANSMIFLMLGLTESYLIADMGRLVHVLLPLTVAILMVLLSRAIIVSGFSGIYNLCTRRANRIPLPIQTAMTWSGLRGALPIALAVSIPSHLITPDERKLIIQLTVGVILFTLLIQGTTIKALLHRLGLDRIDRKNDQP